MDMKRTSWCDSNVSSDDCRVSWWAVMQVIPAGVSGSSVMMLGRALNNYPQVQKQKLWGVNHLRQSVYLDHPCTWQHSVYLQINLELGRYNVSSASCGYESFDRMTYDAVVALHKNVQIVVMQKCRVMKKLLSVNTFHSLWVATTQFFFSFHQI